MEDNCNSNHPKTSPFWFRILFSLLLVVIFSGIIYSVLYSHGVFSSYEKIDPTDSVFNVTLKVTSEDDITEDITALISYNIAEQKLSIETGAEEPDMHDTYHVSVRASDLINIINKAGGILYTNDNGEQITMTGEEACRFVLDDETSLYSRAYLITAFLENLREYADNEVSALRLLAYSYNRIDTDITLKAASAVGKSILKADVIEMEILNEEN